MIELSDMRRIVVAVDPAITSGDDADETGIIIVAQGPHIELEHAETTCRIANCTKHGYVLDDKSGKFTPDGWANVVTEAFHHWKADRIVFEGNQGGEMGESVLRSVFPAAPFKRVHARMGKRTRAEPVAALYEQGRVHHVGSFPKLEDQLTTWTPDSGESPDRLDALVWGLVELGLTGFGGAKEWLESLAGGECLKCGMPYDKGGILCGKCGAALPQTEPEDNTPSPEPGEFSLTSGMGFVPPPNPQIDRVQDAIRTYGPQQFRPFQRNGW